MERSMVRLRSWYGSYRSSCWIPAQKPSDYQLGDGTPNGGLALTLGDSDRVREDWEVVGRVLTVHAEVGGDSTRWRRARSVG